MPQKSPVYAVTRIRVHEKDMVKPERMARMAEAGPAEVMRALGTWATADFRPSAFRRGQDDRKRSFPTPTPS